MSAENDSTQNEYRDETEYPYFHVHNQVVEKWGLDVYEFAAYSAIKCAAGQSKSAYPSHKTIAQRFGMSVMAVRRALDSLKAKGVISIKPRFGNSGRQTSNLYTALKVAKDRELPLEPLPADDTPPVLPEHPPLFSQNTPPVLPEQPGTIRIEQNEKEQTGDPLPNTENLRFAPVDDKSSQSEKKDSIPQSKDEKVDRRPPKDLIEFVANRFGVDGHRRFEIAHCLNASLKGKSKRRYNLETPVTVNELEQWILWYQDKYPGISIPLSLEKLQSSIMTWQRNQLPLVSIDDPRLKDISEIDDYVIPINQGVKRRE